ncbi:synaptic vesicular amine transporter [Lepeophtheirus salmonis]|uniref:synaptic vesicular amine transporter n=1 Tax=Lepeophtheirus salmonis TaxID=72036 RepID=UPI001AE3FABA|nr:synaptic vesicular amine transporter-like [Lepeophtheirus salmonis]
MKSRSIFIRVYIAMILDNVLLTVVVPILPNFIYNAERESQNLESRHQIISKENGRIGYLFASKALVQLVTNFLIGKMTTMIGYRLPFTIGSIFLLFSSLIYTLSSRYIWLLLARSVHGIGSSCVCVSGIGMIASNYGDDEERSKIMSHTMGGVAIGILIGYSMGGFLYYLAQSKLLPFALISFVLLIFTMWQLLLYSREASSLHPFGMESRSEKGPSTLEFLQNRNVLIVVGSIWIATSSVGILEPTLPLWIMDRMHPRKWQLGITFVSDSIGYLIGTHFFAGVSYRVGRKKIGVGAICLVGIGSISIPHATSLPLLTIPQFMIGLGIGLIDSSMLPLLAKIIDQTSSGEAYGVVYAIAETAVSFAYGISPLIGSLSVEMFGFCSVFTLLGLMNMTYVPILFFLDENRERKCDLPKYEENEMESCE